MNYIIYQKIDQNEVLKCLMGGLKPREKYPEEVRKFCYALSYNSPAAYEIVRNLFNNNLPHLSTLRKWLQSSDINGEPGMNEETMKRLRDLVNDLKGEPLVCSLIFDEIYIRKQIFWDTSKSEYAGYTTYGKQPKC